MAQSFGRGGLRNASTTQTDWKKPALKPGWSARPDILPKMGLDRSGGPVHCDRHHANGFAKESDGDRLEWDGDWWTG